MCYNCVEKLRSLGHSFRCAFGGVGRCIWQERNFRIHLTAAVFLFWLASCLPLTRGEWALLLLAVGLMLAAELFNTSLEWLCDQFAPGWDKVSRRVKDLAAGAVLVCAVFCAAAGIALLWRPQALAAAAVQVLESPARLAAVAAAGAAAAVFVWIGPAPLVRRARRLRTEDLIKGKERNA